MKTKNISVQIEEGECFGSRLMRAYIFIFNHKITTRALDIEENGGRIKTVNELQNMAYQEVSNFLDGIKSNINTEFYSHEKGFIDNALDAIPNFQEDVNKYKQLKEEVYKDDDDDEYDY